MIRAFVFTVSMLAAATAFAQEQQTDTSKTPQPAIMGRANNNPAKSGPPRIARPAAAPAEADPGQPTGTPAEPKPAKSEDKKPQATSGEK